MAVFEYDMRWIDEDAAQQLLSGFNETLKCLRADRQTDKTDRHTAQLLTALPHRTLSTISMSNSTIPWLDEGILIMVEHFQLTDQICFSFLPSFHALLYSESLAC